jgi:hypothetical protein
MISSVRYCDPSEGEAENRPTDVPKFLNGQPHQTLNMGRRKANCKTFSESHGRVSSWLSEAPPMFLRSHSFLEREQQPRDHHRENPKAQLRSDSFEGKEISRHTRCFHYCAETKLLNERRGNDLESLTGQAVFSLHPIKT